MTAARALLLLSLLCLPCGAQAREMEDMNVAVLRTIDKISARTNTFEIPVDKTVKFGNSLFIKPRGCRKASALEEPESAAFLQIWERRPHEDKAHWVFSGWMFASNPSLSAIDHPVYDVWVIDCKNAATTAKKQEFSSEHAPEAGGEEAEKPAAAAPAPTKDKPAADKPAGDKPAEEKPTPPAAGIPKPPVSAAPGSDAVETPPAPAPEDGAYQGEAED